MPARSVGVRLAVSGANAAVTQVERMAKANQELAASYREVGVAAGEANASLEKRGVGGAALGAQTAAQKEATLATEEATVASGAAVTQSVKRTAAIVNEEKATKNLTTGWAGLSTQIQTLGSNAFVRKTSMFGGLGLAAMVYEGFKQYSAINTQMRQLSAQAGVSLSRLGPLTGGVLDIGKATGQNLQSVGQGLYYIASSQVGLHATNRELITMARQAANLNVLGNVGQSQAVSTYRLLGNLEVAAKAGKLPGMGNTQHIAAMLNAAVGSGDITMGSLLTAVGRGLIPATEALRVPFPTALAWVTTMTKMGMQPGQIGTLISHAVQQLPGITAQGVKVQEMLGLQPGQLANIMSAQGPGAAMQVLISHMQRFSPLNTYPASGANAPGMASAKAQLLAWGMTPQMIAAWQGGNLASMGPNAQGNFNNLLLAKMFGGARQELPLLMLAENQPLYNTLLKYIKTHSTPAEYKKDLNIALNSPAATMARAGRNIQALLYTVGQDVAPFVQKGAKLLGDVASFLSAHKLLLRLILGALVSLVVVTTSMVAYTKLIAPMMRFFGGTLGGAGKFVWQKLLGFGGGGVVEAQQGATTTTAADIQKVAADTNLRASEMMMAAADRFAEVSGVSIGRSTGTSVIGPSGETPVSAEGELAGAAKVGIFAGIMNSIKANGAKLFQGAFRGFIVAQILNSFQGSLQKYLGKGGASALVDTLTGAAAGSKFGPEGTIAGALIGIEKPLENWMRREFPGKTMNLGQQFASLGSLFKSKTWNTSVGWMGHDVEHYFDDIFGRHPTPTPSQAATAAKRAQDQQTKNAQIIKAAADKMNAAVDKLQQKGIPVTVTTSTVAAAATTGMQNSAARAYGRLPTTPLNVK